MLQHFECRAARCASKFLIEARNSAVEQRFRKPYHRAVSEMRHRGGSERQPRSDCTFM
jgi:hypothetical protein